jgi:hypothetical protein
MCHLIITNNLKVATISIPSPFDQQKTVDLSISLNSKPKKSIKFINNLPYIIADININANILSIDSNINYLDEENINLVQEYANNYMKTNINSYLYKTSKEYKADIAGFGNYARKYYLTIDDWNNSDWQNNYQNAFFNVNVQTIVQSSSLFNKI